MAAAGRRAARDDPRPWLYATARNLLLEEARRSASRPSDILEPERVAPAPELEELDPDLAAALRSLSPLDQEALLLVAWEDLTPSRAAETLGISPVAFRVRLLRARRRLRARLERPAPDDLPATAVPRLDVEET